MLSKSSENPSNMLSSRNLKEQKYNIKETIPIPLRGAPRTPLLRYGPSNSCQTVWHQFSDPGGVKGLVGLLGESVSKVVIV